MKRITLLLAAALTFAVPAFAQVTIRPAPFVSGAGVARGPIQVTDGTLSAPSLTFANETNSGWYRVSSGVFRFSRQGTDQFQIGNGSVSVNALFFASSGIAVGSDNSILPEAANILAQRMGTNPQIFRVYNTFTDASNYERGFMKWSANLLSVGTESAGTGTARSLAIASAGNVFMAPAGGNNTFIDGTNGFGYNAGSGAGGTIAQGTDKSTGVTLNKSTGQITMQATALNTNTSVTFTFTNSTIVATDVVIVNITSAASANSYVVTVDQVSAGSCRIHLRNVSGGSLSEALVLNFAVIKGSAT